MGDIGRKPRENQMQICEGLGFNISLPHETTVSFSKGTIFLGFWSKNIFLNFISDVYII